MIGYTTLGTADFERARAFYDTVLAELGAQLLYAGEREAYWGDSPEGTKFAVVLPLDGEPASVGNGSMVALKADSRDQVDATYRSALDHGGTDEGGPGPRGKGTFYGAYFRDPDGHKICVFVT
ncbi:MAG: VOC family protein [Deltaproteobacteria bacterium]|nr:VOC family protein [Deltaproteobacteria bacterium]